MNKKEIDRLFDAVKNEDIEQILRLAGIEVDQIEFFLEDYYEENEEEILSNIMKKIEEGDYKYFLETGTKDQSFVTELATYSQNKELVFDLLDKKDEYEFNNFEIIKLLKMTDDPKYIESYIERKDEFGFDKYDLVQLIKATKDPKYIEKMLEKRDDHNIELWETIDIIRSIDDQDSIIKFIDKRKEYKLEQPIVAGLIRSIKDPEQIKKYINNSEEYGLDSSMIAGLIEKTNDPKYIESYIERKDEFGFDKNALILLIKATKNPEYIEKIVKKRNDYKFELGETIDIIRSIDDQDSIIKFIDKRREYELEGPIVSGLIRSIKDPEQIKKYINNREEYGLDSSVITGLIEIINDPNYTKECLERKDEFGFDKACLKELILDTRDKEYILEQLLPDEYLSENENLEIKLPDEMTIGIEIESERDYKKLIPRNFFTNGWKSKRDGSLNNGIEVVSPILKGDGKKNASEIVGVCGILQAFGQKTSERCGGHVHIGADYLTTKESWDSLGDIIGNTEEILYAISNKEGETPRDGVIRFAKPFSSDLEKKLSKGTIELNDENDIKNLMKEVQSGDRYYGINFQNLGNSKNTIEFRLPNGTVDPRTWIENINLFGGIVKAAEELGRIQNMPEEERTEEDNRKLELLELLKKEDITQEDKLEAFLGLTISEENRDVYRKRYEVNSKLISQKPEVENQIKGKTAKKPINIGKKSIGKKCFTGEDPVTGIEYDEGTRIIERDQQELMQEQNQGQNIEDDSENR